MKELKDSTAQLKEGIRDIIDDSENPIVQRAREEAAKLRWETEQAKAIRVVRLIDPNFDIYETENELEQIIRDVYESHLSEDLDYVQSVTFGQAQSYFDGQVKEWEKTKMKPARREII
jgi:import inner membrane translocase subunit TIM44